MTLDDLRRRSEHAHSCWDGCDDLHPDGYGFCGRPDCGDDCVGDDNEAGPPQVITVHGFEDRGLL